MATTPEGLEYVRGQLAYGVTKDQIAQSLTAGGWHDTDIADAFAAIEAVTPAPTHDEPVISRIEPIPLQAQPAPLHAEPVTLQAAPMPQQADPVTLQAEPMPLDAETIPLQAASVTPQAEPVTSIPLGDIGLDVGLQRPNYAPRIQEMMPHQEIYSEEASVPARRTSRHHPVRIIALSVLVIFLVSAIGAGAYVVSTNKLALVEQYAIQYVGAYLPFLSHPPYQRGSVLSGTALGLSQVKTSAWEVKVHIYTEPRDPGAAPFSLSKSATTTEAISLLTMIIPSDFDASSDISGAAQKTATGIDGRAAIAFDLTSEDLSASLAAEFRKVGDNFYGIVTKVPGFFGDISAIKNQWVVVTSADQKEYGDALGLHAVMPDNLNAQQAQSQQDMQTILSLEEKDNLLTAAAPKLVSQDGTILYEYDLALNPAALPIFYADAMQALANASSSAYFSTSTLTYLQSDDGKSLAQYLASNLSIVIWADSKGIPHHFQFSLRVVPTDDMAKLAGKQVRVTGDLVLSSINQPISIDAPTPTIPVATAYQMVTGQSLAQALSERRDSTRMLDLFTINMALDEYYLTHRAYPASLSLLASSTRANTLDPLDQTPYPYTSSGASYTLGADLEATSSAPQLFGEGTLLKTSCSGAITGRYCYQIKPVIYKKISR